MKMAKATPRDMEAAMAVTHILEALCKGYLPDALEHLDSNFFDIDNHEHCSEVLGLLIEKANSASIFRVTFGMQVMLDPVNKMVDPALSYLEHHPERLRADELLQAFNRTTPAAADVLAERRRQVESEGWTPEHDDEHANGELASAAACYALNSAVPMPNLLPPYWPWARAWWKPADPRRDLVKAGALILAEIERLDRATAAIDAAIQEGGAA